MAHYHYIEDEKGNLVDLIPFCSDSCHQDYCYEHGIEYGGWNGAHGDADGPEYCAQCGTVTDEAECGCDAMVGGSPSDTGEKCEHGNWIQVPASYLDK